MTIDGLLAGFISHCLCYFLEMPDFFSHISYLKRRKSEHLGPTWFFVYFDMSLDDSVFWLMSNIIPQSAWVCPDGVLSHLSECGTHLSAFRSSRRGDLGDVNSTHPLSWSCFFLAGFLSSSGLIYSTCLALLFDLYARTRTRMVGVSVLLPLRFWSRTVSP